MAKRGGGTRAASSSSASASRASGSRTTAKVLNSLPIRNGMSNLQTGDLAAWENALRNIPNGETYSIKLDAGTTTFGKSSNGDYWINQAPWNDRRNYSTPVFISEYLASMGNIKRGEIERKS